MLKRHRRICLDNAQVFSHEFLTKNFPSTPAGMGSNGRGQVVGEQVRARVQDLDGHVKAHYVKLRADVKHLEGKLQSQRQKYDADAAVALQEAEAQLKAYYNCKVTQGQPWLSQGTLGPSTKLCLAMSLEPRALRHEPLSMSHKPLTIYRFTDPFPIPNLRKWQCPNYRKKSKRN